MAKKQRHKHNESAPESDPTTGLDTKSRRSGTVPVVGLCSSAGGLDALTRFFRATPPKSGVAFLVVPHLDPTHKSLLVDLLNKETAMPVAQVGDGDRVRPDFVYVIPPNRSLAIHDGVMRLSETTEPRGAPTVIDAFLRSLAADQRERAIAIVLSGTGSHGALGIREIKLAGGMVMAQDPRSAEYDAMPRSAIATGTVDHVLEPEEMPAALIDYVRHPYVGERMTPSALDDDHERLTWILANLRARTKYDFRYYRKNMLVRRVQRRMSLCHLQDLAGYQQRLRDDPDEVVALYKDLLIGVTAFFREPEAFHVLQQRVIPRIVERNADETPVRVWVPACATGEEAYSIGMLLIEAFEAAKRQPNVQIFATDLDEESLDVARHGLYPDSIAGDVTEDRLQRFFVKRGENRFQVSKQLRDSVVFAQQSLIGDAPFSRIDLVGCRNLLIYLEPEMQEKVIRLLHFALNEGGYLLLGPSESIGRQPHLFEAVSKKWRVYRRVGPTRHELVDIPITRATVPRLATSAGVGPEGRPTPAAAHRLSELAHRVLLQDYAPASVLVTRQYQILHYHGPMVDYLEFPSGQPSSDLLAMSRQGLRTRIRSAVIRSTEARAPVVDEDARVKRDGKYAHCRIAVKPLLNARGAEDLFLVSFQDLEPAEEPRPATGKRSSTAPPDEGAQIVEQLESELKATREDLQSTIEELESANEVLQSSNQEIMSMNEELQSTNEELETSKEELQSMNEELNTVNSELQGKVQALEDVNNDITNLLSATDVATLFLDAEMRIKLFTPPTGELLCLLGTDIGRPISDFSFKVANDDLVADARTVIEDPTPIEKEVWSQGPEKRCYLRRIVPYKTSANRIEGVVVTFIDVTTRKRNETDMEARIAGGTAEVHRGRERLRSVIETVVDAIITIDARGIVGLFNSSAERMFGYEADEVLGRNVQMLMPAPFSDEHDQYIEDYLRTGKAKMIGIGREVEARRKDGTTFPARLTVAEAKEDGGVKFVGVVRDLTELATARVALSQGSAINDSIVSTARAIILRLDREGRILTFNPYMEERSGYKLKEVEGRDWFTVFVPERERELVRREFEKAIRGNSTQGNISSIRTKDGNEILVEWYDDLLRVPGEPVSRLLIGQDVTARDKLQREFLQAQKLEAVGRLAGGVAHDFNNMLAGIHGGLRIASKELGFEHPAARRMLDQVVEVVERGASITRRLLDFSRVRNHPRPPRLIDAREFLSGEHAMMRRLIGEDVDLRITCDASSSRIRAEEGQLEQSILNLAINARDAMPHGGKLEIGCRDVDLSREDMAQLGASLEPGPYVVLSIADSGHGMDEETRSKALEPFFTTKELGLGTGLGLSSVATMMEQYGGHLALESEVDVGTTVTLVFPRTNAVRKTAADEQAPAKPPEHGNGETILVVEDELLVRLGVQHMLEEAGYTALTAANPTAALAELESMEGTIHLLLTDVVLPGMSGPELATAARQHYPKLRVLYMSAFSPADLVAQGRIPPEQHTLQKPFSPELLAATVRLALAPTEPTERRPD